MNKWERAIILNYYKMVLNGEMEDVMSAYLEYSKEQWGKNE